LDVGFWQIQHGHGGVIERPQVVPVDEQTNEQEKRVDMLCEKLGLVEGQVQYVQAGVRE
jgi:hypothetical protein